MSCPLPQTPCMDCEDLADKLHAEQLEHGSTRERLATALRELEQLRTVAESARAVVLVTTTRIFSARDEKAMQRLLALGLLDLAFVLAQLPKDGSEEVAAHG